MLAGSRGEDSGMDDPSTIKMSKAESDELRKLGNLRNPLAHFRTMDDPTHVDRRSMHEKAHYLDILRQDAFFAIALVMRILAKKPFRIG